MTASSPSVGILTYNTRDIVLQNVTKLLRSGLDAADLVIWDNASTDQTAPALEREFPDVCCISSATNLGYAGGMNKLVSSLVGPKAILLTADCLTSAAAIGHLRQTLLDEPRIAVCGGRLIDGRTSRIQSEGGTITFPLGITIPRLRHQPADLPPGPAVDVAYVDGAFLGIDVGRFKELGGFNPVYFAYYEEVDLCWRARMRGFRVVCDPSALGTHLTYGSWGQYPLTRWKLTERNRIATNVTNLEPFNLIVAVLSEMLYGCGIVVAGNRLAPSGYAGAYGSAILEVLSSLPGILRSRSLGKASRTIRDEEVLKLHARMQPLELFSELRRQRSLFYEERGAN